MRKLPILIFVAFLDSITFGQSKTITDFSNTQRQRFDLIQTFKTGYFVNSVENHELHVRKIEKALKAKAAHSNKNSYGKSVFTRIQMWQFDFASSGKYNQVIDSLFKCFPYDCNRISEGEDKAIKIIPSIWIFAGNSIYIASTHCEQVDDKWRVFIKEFASEFAETDSKIILTECGKLTWTTKQKLKNAP